MFSTMAAAPLVASLSIGVSEISMIHSGSWSMRNSVCPTKMAMAPVLTPTLGLLPRFSAYG